MAEQTEKIFADGFIFKEKEHAPDFVIGAISIKVEEAVAFIKSHQKNGWVNLDVKRARSGKAYIQLDTFEPSGNKPNPEQDTHTGGTPPIDDGTDDLPF